ncbi:uncharacterized protein [Primulina eburnea]|uniref:uncharacterized protein n=1 Tax=Primulina eburnea TaxID=1245227 RepID=UPI003C6C153E
MPSFWKSVVYAVKVGGPVVKVLRLVDGEKPPMSYIYEAMDRDKEAIDVSFDHKDDKYKDIFAIIDHRWTIQLHRPLHPAGHFLNPEFFYSDSNIENDNDVVTGLYKYIARMCEPEELQDKIMDQLPMSKKTDAHGSKTKRQKITRALRHRYDMCDTIDPISLADIDDSNEWLMGELNYNSGDENNLVFDDDCLTCGEVGQASGVDEDAYNFRSRGPSSTKEASVSTSTLNTYKRRSTIHRYNNEDDEDIDFGENDEESEG